MNNVKFYILAFVGNCLLFACTASKDEPQEPIVTPASVPLAVADSAIVFDAALDAVQATTRTEKTAVFGTATPYNEGITSLDGLKSASFGVYAYYTGTKEIDDSPTQKQVVMNNQKIFWDTNKWKTSAARYWPGSNQYLSFFSYAPYSSTGVSLTGTTTTGSVTSFSGDIQYPTVSYDVSTQDKDFLIGVDSITGQSLINLLRPTDNKVQFTFKHALARARFSLSNYLSYEDAYQGEAYGIGGAGSTSAHFLGDGEYTINGNTKKLKGWYVHFAEDGEAIFHKYSDETKRRLVITGISFKNLNKTGDLLLRTDADGDTQWTNTTKYDALTPYTLTPMNPNIYKSIASGTITEELFNALNDVDASTAVPLNVALDGSGAIDATKEHYVLMIPQAYDSEATDNIEVTITYQVCTKVVLEGIFSWSNAGTGDTSPVYQGDANPYSRTEFYASKAKSISGTIQFDLNANKSYHVVITLGGKLMRLLYEVTDWDDYKVIDIPQFE